TSKTRPVEVRGIRLEEYKQINALGSDDGLFYSKYYPGTTALAPSSQPVYGFDDKSVPVLPEPFESAWRKALAAQSPVEREKWLENWPRLEKTAFPGPGIFAPDESPEGRPRLIGQPLHGIIIGRDLLALRKESGEYERRPDYPRGMMCQLSLLP